MRGMVEYEDTRDGARDVVDVSDPDDSDSAEAALLASVDTDGIEDTELVRALGRPETELAARE